MSEKNFIKIFSEISSSDNSIAGGKGASLGEMTRSGIPVPPGFIVLSGAFDEFLKETDINIEIDATLRKVDPKKVHTIENASEEIQALIMSKEIPSKIKKEILFNFKKLKTEYVAVRSSATSEDSALAAWAGQLDSFLNTTEKSLLNNVKKCWASLFTPRAIFYRFEQKLHKTKISVAVVVQKMIQSEKSGIAFSVHPVTEDPNQLIIEAGYGLGEAIVSGQITPDSYVVSKTGISEQESVNKKQETRNQPSCLAGRRALKLRHGKQKTKVGEVILDINVNEQSKGLYKKFEGGNEWRELGEKGKKQVLDEEEIIELSKLIICIEKHYGFPCDIEWAKEKGKFYIVQSRPITTLNSEHQIQSQFDEELIDYTNSQKWGCFKNSKRKLLYSSLWVRGVRKKMALIDKNVIANEDIDVNTNPEKVLRVFNLSQPQLNDDIISKHLINPKSILRYIDKNYELLEDAKAISSNINEALVEDDCEAIGERALEFIDIYEQMSAYEYFINGLAQGLYENFKAEKNQKIKEKVNKWRNDESIDRTSVILKNILDYIFIREKINLQSSEAINFLHIDEFIGFLKKRISNNEMVSIIKNRSEHGYILLNFKEKKYQNKILDVKTRYEMREIEKFVNSIHLLVVKQKITDKNLIQGQSIFKIKNTFRGECVIVNQEKDLTKNIDVRGKILVTTMTTPKFIPYLKNIKGIITDNGGLICHAAIISRELNIPCIIGTEVATSILKDGDLVEVDAYNGVVRILEKAKKEKEKVRLVLGNQDIDSSMLTVEMTWEGIASKKIKAQIGLSVPPIACELIKGRTINGYLDPEKFRVFVNRCAKRILADDILLKNLIKKSEKLAENVRNISLENIDSVGNMNNTSLAKLVEKMKNYQRDLAAYGMVIAFADVFGEISDKVSEIINSRKKLAHPSYIYSKVLCNPETKSLTEQAYREIRKSKLAEKKLAQKYFWLDQGYIGRGISEQEIGEMKKDKPEEENLPSEKELLRELSLTKVEEKILDVSKDLIYTKSLRADSRQFIHVVINRIVDKLATDWNESVGNLEALTADELIAILRNKKKLPSDLESRSEYSVFVPKKNGYKILKEEEAKIFIQNNILKPAFEKADEIKGQVANPGKVMGKVRLIFGPQHNGKVEKGDILISTVTSPQLLPAMKKAAAFITDLGGITSHAAIVSRELSKPCIVGTKIATQVLRDGDLVEVDADSGVVRIIEKAENLEDPIAISAKEYIYVSNREITLLEMSLIIESYKYQYKKIDKLYNLGRFLADRTVLIGKNTSVDMYRIKDSIKKASDYSAKLIGDDKYLLQKLAGISIKMACVVDKKCDLLEKIINKKNISRKKLGEFYFQWRKLFLEFFPMQVLPLGLERSLESGKKDILIKNKDVLVAWRNETQETQMRLEKVFSLFLKKAGGSFIKNIAYCSDQEIVAYFEKNIPVNNKEIFLRRKKYMMIWDIEQSIPYILHSGENADVIIEMLEAKKLQNNTNGGILHGNGIGSGLRKATAYIIQKKSDFDFLPNDLIVVAKVLELEDIYKLKNKKICGVITEEGGITSHIAIVGRELNVPIVACIKNATQILKNGDLIEVDADKGIVRFLKK